MLSYVHYPLCSLVCFLISLDERGVVRGMGMEEFMGLV